MDPTSICAGCALVLQGDQGEVDTFLFQQLAVCPPLHGLSMLKANDDVCISNGGQTVGYGNRCSAHSHLHIFQLLEPLSTKQQCVVKETNMLCCFR